MAIGNVQLLLLKNASEVLTGAIAKGSADQAARGDYDYTVQDQFELAIDVNEPRLIGTSLVAGSMYAMMIKRYYEKLKMAERIVIVSRLLGDITTSLNVIDARLQVIKRLSDEIAVGGLIQSEYEMKMMAMTTQMSIVGTERRKLDAYVLMLQGLNDVSVEQIVRQNDLDVSKRRYPFSVRSISLEQELAAVDALLKEGNLKGLDPADANVIRELFQSEADNIMGIKGTLNTVSSYTNTLDDAIRNAQALAKATTGFQVGTIPSAATIRAMGMKVADSASLMVVQASEGIEKIRPKVQTIATASDDVAKIAGSPSKLVGVAVGKVFLVDSIIWGVSLGLDLGLNLFLTEEEQANLPVVGFLFEGAGWSPIGALIEGIIDFFVEPETQQTLFDVFIATLVAASQEETIGEAMLMILDFYIDNVSAELLMPLEFDREITMDSPDLLRKLAQLEPLLVLEVALYLVVAKIVFYAWIIPAYGFFSKQVGWSSTA